MAVSWSPERAELAVLAIETLLLFATGEKNHRLIQCDKSVFERGAYNQLVIKHLHSKKVLAEEIITFAGESHKPNKLLNKDINSVAKDVNDVLDRLEDLNILKPTKKARKAFEIISLFGETESWQSLIIERFKVERNKPRTQQIDETDTGQSIDQSPGVQTIIDLRLSGTQNFLGRDKFFSTIHHRLNQERHNQRWLVLQGMPGVGKSELALQYALKHKDDYTGGILWIDTRGGESEIAARIISFAKARLNLPVPDDPESSLADRVKWCWDRWNTIGKPVLLIFDDLTREVCESIASPENSSNILMPINAEQFRVLITSRYDLGDPFYHIDIPVLDSQHAIELLNKTVSRAPERLEGDENQAISIEIVETLLGYLPLGIELIGRYLNQRRTLSIPELVQQLKAQKLKDRCSLEKGNQVMTAQRGVWAALSLSWKALDEEAQELAMRLGLCAFTSIPWEMIEKCYAPGADLYALAEARDFQLVNASLLKWSNGEYRLHMLVWEFFREQLDMPEHVAKAPTWKKEFCHAVAYFIQYIDEFATEAGINNIRPIIPHAIHGISSSYGSQESIDALMQMFSGVFAFFYSQGLYKEGIKYAEQWVADARLFRGEQHLDVAISLNNLASLYYTQGHYEKAELLHIQALELFRSLSGEQQPHVATSFNNLAEIYYAQGHHERAKPLYIQALELFRSLFGEQHPYVATSIDNLAKLYCAQGHYEEAEPLYKQALELRRSLLGEQHPSIAASLNGLAGAYRAQGHYEKAEPLYIEALELRRSLLGEQHPDVAMSLNSLALLYDGHGCYEKAEPLYIEALELFRSFLGEQHPDLVGCLNNLARNYHNRGHYEKAEPLYIEALNLSDLLFNEHHHKVKIRIRSNLVELYYAQGRYEKAEPLCIQALELRRSLLGEQHPDVASTFNMLAEIYCAQGRYEKAEPLYIQALELRRSLLGEQHPDVASTFNSLATHCLAQGRYKEAEFLYKQALECFQFPSVEPHPHIASSISGLALVYHAVGHYQEAEFSYKQALEGFRLLSIKQHPNVASSANGLAQIYYAQGRHEEAECLYIQALECFRSLFGEQHPCVILSLNNLIEFYHAQGRYTEATSLRVKALEI
jgi:tetratricopeptide (TPR) repeat protein